MLQRLNLSLISIICKKIYSNFFHNLSTTHCENIYYKNTVESISILGYVYVRLRVGVVVSSLVGWCGVKKILCVVQIFKNYDCQLTHTAYLKFPQYQGMKFSIIWMHRFQSYQPKIVSFCFCFIYIVFNMFDIIVADSATDVKPIININNS